MTHAASFNWDGSVTFDTPSESGVRIVWQHKSVVKNGMPAIRSDKVAEVYADGTCWLHKQTMKRLDESRHWLQGLCRGREESLRVLLDTIIQDGISIAQ